MPDPIARRAKYSAPLDFNADFAWLLHFIDHLAPHGMTGIVLTNGSMPANQSGDW